MRNHFGADSETRGLQVLEAGDGRSSVELARTHHSEIDVAVLDVTLPGLTGREVLENCEKPTLP